MKKHVRLVLPITPITGEGRMRTFIFALAAIVPAFAIDRARAADELPELNIARNCKGARDWFDRCDEGIERAKRKGTQFGRPSRLDAGQKRKIAERYSAGETMAEPLADQGALELSNTAHDGRARR
jgi:hypothetical protein